MSAIRKPASSPKRRPAKGLDIKGIEFRETAAGRRPFVAGTGLTVWELYHVWLDHKRNVHSVLQSLPRLTAAKIYAAVAYATEHPKEEPKGAWGIKPKRAKTFRT